MKFFIVADSKHIYKQDSLGKLIKLEELNRTEYLILSYLYENKKDIVSRETLIEQGWPGRVVSENSLNVAMMKLRRKLAKLNEFARIETFLGEGYRLTQLEDFSLETVENINSISLEEPDLKAIKDEGADNSEPRGQVNPRDRLSDFLINCALWLKSAGSKTRKYLSLHPRLQLLLGILCCMLLFVYFYSEAWSTFICTEETVCSDYLRLQS